MKPKDLIKSYYDSLGSKDDKWKDMWADDAIFSDASKTLVAKGKEEIIQSFTIFLKGVASITVKQVIAEEDNICAVVGYNYQNQKGAEMSQDDAEVWMVQDGKLAQLIIYTDLTAYRTFMKG